MYAVNMIHLGVLWVSLYVYLSSCCVSLYTIDRICRFVLLTMFVIVHSASPPLSLVFNFCSHTASIVCSHKYPSYATSISGYSSCICSTQGLEPGRKLKYDARTNHCSHSDPGLQELIKPWWALFGN